MSTLRYGQPRKVRQIQSIQASYLTQHFLQISTILYKHLRQAIATLKINHSLHPSLYSHRLKQLHSSLARLVLSKKKSYLHQLSRRLKQKVYEEQRACLKVVQTLSKRVTLLLVQGLMKISQRESSKEVSKDRALFLIISLSNLNKMVVLTKNQAIEAIKQEARRKTLLINKCKALALEQALSVQIDSHKRWAFNNLFCFQESPVGQTYAEETQSEDDGQEQILIECYKSMAFNLQGMMNRPRKSTSSDEKTKQMGLKLLCRTLNGKLQQTVCSILVKLLGSGRGREETLLILRRQIAILEKEYQSV